MKTIKNNTRQQFSLLQAFNPRKWACGLMGLTFALTATTGLASDDQWTKNRLATAEAQGDFHQSIWNYNGIDPSIRFMQAILWMGGFEGDGDGPVEEGGGDDGDGDGGEEGGGGQEARSDSYIELTPIPVDGGEAKHRVILPLQDMGDGREGYVDGQSAFLEIKGRNSVRYERLIVMGVTSTPEGLTDGVVITPLTDNPEFAIVIACSVDGAIDWDMAPGMVSLVDRGSEDAEGGDDEATPLIHRYTPVFKREPGPWNFLTK